eukprot:scaffold47_cov172-Ochromonas_danica.AAC.6
MIRSFPCIRAVAAAGGGVGDSVTHLRTRQLSWSTLTTRYLATSSPITTNMTKPSSSKPNRRETAEERELKIKKTRDNYTALSFYKFLPIDQDYIPVLINHAKEILSPHGIRGTLLIATEGINAAFAVKTTEISSFPDLLRSVDNRIFSDIDFNYGEELQAISPYEKHFPFQKLLIRKKKEALRSELIGTSPLLETLPIHNEANRGHVLELDCNDAGPELTPQEWHEEIITGQKNGKPPILLDCRNDYESDEGIFMGAQPLNTTRFSETFELLDNMLANADPHQRILTYCTGGVRCVKVNAYLKQVKGFNNIGRLYKGIIHYENWAAAQGKDKLSRDVEVEKKNVDLDKASVFLGTNFLFDRRRLISQTEEDTNSAASTTTINT